MKEISSFFTPSRQSPIAILIFLIKFLRVTVRQGWAGVISLAVFFRRVEFSEWFLYAGVLTIVALYIFFSIYSYLKFYYYLKEGEIVIKKGIFTKTTINLPFEKIQTIDFKQNLIQQVFGVVEFAIDSAGSKKQEVSLSAVPLDMAEQLREYILEEKKSLISESVEDAEEQPETTKAPKSILRLSIPDLLKVGITQNHIKSLGLILVFFFGLLEQVRKLTEETDLNENQFEETVNSYFEETLLIWIWTFSIAFLLFVPVVVSLVTTVFRYFDMQLLLGNDGLKLKSGLLNKKQKSTTLRKIQTISWGWNPLQYLVGFFTIKIYPATASSIKVKNILTIPGSRAEQIEKLLKTLGFTEKSQNLKEHKMSPLYYIRAFWVVGLIPAIIVGAILFYFFTWSALFILLWPAFIFTESYIEYKKWRLLVNEHVLKIRYGLFGLHYNLIYWHKIQAVRISQSPYQRRKNLATIVCYQAGHQMRIPYISIDLARQIEQYALYQIETDRVGWM